jgi:Polyketide cyclase / dehydrase and lipid transport
MGAAVAAFGLLLARLAVGPARALRRWTQVVVAANGLWLAGTAVLLAVRPLPVPGVVAVVAVAVAVADLAVGQLVGLAAARPDDPFGDVEVMEAHRRFAAAPDVAWPLLTDHNLYGRLAPNLRSVQVISDPGQPLRRQCTNTAGPTWQESCTLWDDGHRFAVEVDTTAYPYPLLMLRGLWQVDPDPDGSRVTMRFAFRAQSSVQGGLFAIALRILFKPVLKRILDGWHTRLANAAQPSARGGQ